MYSNRIESPDGVKTLMQDLWQKHLSGEKGSDAKVFIVDLPAPTEEEKRIMAANRAARKSKILDEKVLQTMLENAVERLGGW